MLAKTRDLARFLYAQRVKGFDPPADEPLMDPPGVARFKQELGKATHYVEFGSGGTTVLADRAGIPTISVENDRFYARAVATQLTGKVRQIVVDLGITGEWGYPLIGTRDKGRRYANAPFGKDPFPDFILVDGRYRVACALTATKTAHECSCAATLMFDDYGGRRWYHAIEDWLGRPEMAGRTAIFQIGSQAIPQTAVDAFLSDKR